MAGNIGGRRSRIRAVGECRQVVVAIGISRQQIRTCTTIRTVCSAALARLGLHFDRIGCGFTELPAEERMNNVVAGRTTDGRGRPIVRAVAGCMQCRRVGPSSL